MQLLALIGGRQTISLVGLATRTMLLIGHTFLAGCDGLGPAASSERKGSVGTVTVAAASDLKFALDEIIAAFEQAHPAITMTVSYGSSGNFFAQLSNRAPYDVFLSADVDYARRLADLGLADADTLMKYAIGRLVVWVPRDSPLDVERLGIAALADPSLRKIAIANPQHAPYGRAAEAALRQWGVYDQVADRLVLGENIAQTAQFIDTGAADAGIIALSLALAPALRDRGRYGIVPTASYPALEQGGVVLSWAKDRGAAEQFCRYLRHADTVETLKRFGFDVPDRTP